MVQAFVIAAEDEYLVLRKGFHLHGGHPVFIERVDVRFVVVVCSLFCAERYTLSQSSLGKLVIELIKVLCPLVTGTPFLAEGLHSLFLRLLKLDDVSYSKRDRYALHVVVRSHVGE